MGMILRKIRSVRKVCCPVICIQIYHHSARFQYAEPFLISMLRVRKCPGKVSGYDHIKFLIRKIRIFRIHDRKLAVCFFFLCQLFCMGDHIRCQVDTGYLMAFFCKKNGKKSSPASNIQDPEILFLWQVLLKLGHPSACKCAVKFRSSLFQEAVAALGPVLGDPCFPLVFFSYDISVSDHRATFHNLKTGYLIEDHTIHVRTADFLNISLIITDLAKILVPVNDISWLFHRVPEAVDAGALISDIIHFQRIVGAVRTDSVVSSNAAENVSHIAAHGVYFFTLPGSHAATFQKDCRNVTGTCRVIVGAACAYI